MARTKKINLLSLAKVQAVLLALVGLVLGILYSFGGLIMDTLVSMGWITSSETPGLSFGTLLAFGALIGMPVILAILGFFLGILEALLFNLCARWFGGMEIDLKE